MFIWVPCKTIIVDPSPPDTEASSSKVLFNTETLNTVAVVGTSCSPIQTAGVLFFRLVNVLPIIKMFDADADDTLS